MNPECFQYKSKSEYESLSLILPGNQPNFKPDTGQWEHAHTCAVRSLEVVCKCTLFINAVTTTEST